jgi:AhpD family alkylhydroperoxidase
MPDTLDQFKSKFPQVWAAYQDLKDICDKQGPLDKKTIELVKIGISTALGREGGLIAHISKAKKAGAHDSEIYHSILLAMSLVGFPATLAAFTTAREYLKD